MGWRYMVLNLVVILCPKIRNAHYDAISANDKVQRAIIEVFYF